MEFHCEDLAQFGVVLIPPSSPEYGSLFADIQQRIGHEVDEHRDTSAILVNRSQNAIAAIQQLWTFKETSGRTRSVSSGPGVNPSVLLPFGLPEKHLKLYGYWHVILPGSNRLLSVHGGQIGDNSDVRPPRPDEVWTGGTVGGWGGGRRFRGPLEKVTLTLDGVFFTDGGFAGPNRERLWDRTVATAEAHLRLAKMAGQGYSNGISPQQIFAEIETVTGRAPEHPWPPQPPPPPPPPNAMRTPEREREWESMRNTSDLRRLAFQIARWRKLQGDEATLDAIRAWADIPVPLFRKL